MGDDNPNNSNDSIEVSLQSKFINDSPYKLNTSSMETAWLMVRREASVSPESCIDLFRLTAGLRNHNDWKGGW